MAERPWTGGVTTRPTVAERDRIDGASSSRRPATIPGRAPRRPPGASRERAADGAPSARGSPTAGRSRPSARASPRARGRPPRARGRRPPRGSASGARRVEPELGAAPPDARAAGHVARGQLEQLVEVLAPRGCRACDEGALASLCPRRSPLPPRRRPGAARPSAASASARARVRPRRFAPEDPARGEVPIEHPLERLALARHPGAARPAASAARGAGTAPGRGQAIDEPGDARAAPGRRVAEVLAGGGDVARDRVGDASRSDASDAGSRLA